MYEKSISLLKQHIRSLQEFVADATGVITQYAKEQASNSIFDYERAIAALKLVEGQKPSTNTDNLLLQIRDVLDCKDCSDTDKLDGIRLLLKKSAKD
jgi:hypothetical protein